MSTVTAIDNQAKLEAANDDLAIAWDLAIVLKTYLSAEECYPAATVAKEIERRISQAHNITVDIHPK